MTTETLKDFGIQSMLLNEYGIDAYLVPDNIALTASSIAVLLMVLLLYRVITLYNRSQESDSEEKEKRTPEFLSNLNNFAQFQLNSVRDASGNLGFIGNKEHRVEVGLFFIGAVEFVVRKNDLSSKQRHQLIVQLLQDSMNFSAKEISRVYSQALAVCSNSPSKNTAKKGAKAFKEWSSEESPKVATKLATIIS